MPSIPLIRPRSRKPPEIGRKSTLFFLPPIHIKAPDLARALRPLAQPNRPYSSGNGWKIQLGLDFMASENLEVLTDYEILESTEPIWRDPSGQRPNTYKEMPWVLRTFWNDFAIVVVLSSSVLGFLSFFSSNRHWFLPIPSVRFKLDDIQCRIR